MVLRAHQSQPPNSILIDSAVFAGLTNVTNRQTNRQTDHATLSVAINRICLHGRLPKPFLLIYSVFYFIFSLFFVSGPCARLKWPSRQLLSAR